MWTCSVRQLERFSFPKCCCCCSPQVLELERVSDSHGVWGWRLEPSCPGAARGFGGISGRGWQSRETAQDYPQLLHGTAATPTQSLKTALTQPRSSGESQASGKIPVQGLGKGFLLTSSD